MLLNTEKSGQDKERSEEWLVNTDRDLDLQRPQRATIFHLLPWRRE